MAGITDVLGALDLIDRVDEWFGNARFGPWHKFHIPLDAGCTGWEVEQLLARHGVRIWGRGFTSDSLYFNVKRRQANWAEYLIRRRGIPLSSQLVNPQNETYADEARARLRAAQLAAQAGAQGGAQTRLAGYAARCAEGTMTAW